MIRKYSDIEKLYEGGNAFDDTETQEFEGGDKKIILDKCNHLMKDIFGFQSNDYSFVASFVHKTEDDNIIDVDIVVSEKSKIIDKRLDSFEKVSETIEKLNKIANKHNIKSNMSKSIGVLSLKYQIEKSKYIQIDIIPVPTLEWGRFSYYSPSTEISKYKGLYRNALFEAISKAIHFNKTYFDDSSKDEDNVESYYRFRYLRNLGLWKVKEEKKKKSTKNYTKDRDTYTPVTHSPKKVVNYLLGNYKLNSVYTLENVIKIITSVNYKHSDILDKIFEYYEDYIVNRQKRDLPKIVKRYMKKLK